MIETAVVMCHAPIVVPAIGGGRARDCERTTQGMRRVARTVMAHRPEVVVLITPHAERHPTRFGISVDEELFGDFSRFGQPEVGARFAAAPAWSRRIEAAANAAGLSTWALEASPLDHGSLVPLYFLAEAGFEGPLVVISLPYPGTQTETRFGRALASVLESTKLRTAIVASGDMSHRLSPGAPAGHHPRARDFDARVVEVMKGGEYRRLGNIDPGLRELAAEDFVDSVLVAAAAVGFENRGHEFVSYEGPFGVGYLEAVLMDAQGPKTKPDEDTSSQGAAAPRALLDIARAALGAELGSRTGPVPELPSGWNTPRGVFVTWRRANGELRGCIGHIEPTEPTLADEVEVCAVLAATRDPRFTPVTADEFDDLRVEVSVLGAPERVNSVAELDPNRFGVVVERDGQRGVLLPHIPEVTSAEQQVRIARRKAGIPDHLPCTLFRFPVSKVAQEHLS